MIFQIGKKVSNCNKWPTKITENLISNFMTARRRVLSVLKCGTWDRLLRQENEMSVAPSGSPTGVNI